MKKTLVGFLIVFITLGAFARGAEDTPRTRAVLDSSRSRVADDLGRSKLSPSQAALYRTQAIFAPETLPEKYRAPITLEDRRCLTSDLRLLWDDWDILPQDARQFVPPHMRPSISRENIFSAKGSRASMTMLEAPAKADPGDHHRAPPYDRTYATANFLIHWMSSGEHSLAQNQDTNGSGVPDIVELAGEALEGTRSWMLASGYRMPVDTEDYYLNVYFENLAPGYLGYCLMIDYPASHTRAFISLTNDFSGYRTPTGQLMPAFDLMRATATHEFYHAVQFAYDALEEPWWMEATAVWSQKQPGPAWQGDLSHLGSVMNFLQYPEVSLDDNREWMSWHWYASAMWPIFLQAHIDPSGDIIRQMWEQCEHTNAIKANHNVLATHVTGGFNTAWMDFLVANYKADYPEAAQFPVEYGSLWIEPSIYTYPSGIRSPSFPPAGLGSNYVRFMPLGGAGYNLSLTWYGTGFGQWTGAMMSRQGSNYTREATSSGVLTGLSPFIGAVDEGILVVTPATSGLYTSQHWSFSAALVYGDSLPPAPDPMSFEQAPYAVSTSAIAMTATEAIDSESPPVQYQFEETSGGPGGSGTDWVSSRTHTDAGLAVNTQYTYRVRARDSAPVPNVTRWSTLTSAFTLANTPTAPTLDDPSPTRLYITLGGGDANPAYTEYAVYNVTSSTWVAADGSPSAAAWWATRSMWDGMRAGGLASDTTHHFVVKARNGNGIETDFSPAGSGTTLAADTTPPAVQDVAIIPTWVKEDITTSVTLTATATDIGRGGSDIVYAEYFVDTDPGLGAAIPMQPSDGAFDSPIEALSAPLNTTGWTFVDSPYNIYIRARDEAGFWSDPFHYPINVVDGIPPERIMDLYARPAPPAIEEPVALAVASATSHMAGHEPVRAIDGNAATSWITLPQEMPTAEAIELDVDYEGYLGKVTLKAGDMALFPSTFKVKLYDGDAWYSVVTESDYEVDPDANAWQFGARKASKVRLEIGSTRHHEISGLWAAEIAGIALYTESGGSRAAILEWTAPSDIGPTGQAALYEVRYSTDSAQLTDSFAGHTPNDDPPIPGSPGTREEMDVCGLEPGTIYYFAVRSRDDYDNWSAVSPVATAETLADPNPYVALDSPQDESYLDIPTQPVFEWRSNIYDFFRVQFSNVPDFPLRPYRDERRRLARTISFPVRRGQTTFEPLLGQWRLLKRIASDMDGTLYWRVEARALTNRALGVNHSEVFAQYGFDTGTFTELAFAPQHLKGTEPAVWPQNRPQFAWNVSNPVYGTYFLDFSATPDININDRRNTFSIRSPNRSLTWWRPTIGQWRIIKRRFAGVNEGRIYWRVRGMDEHRAFHAASLPQLMIVNTPTFTLRKPAPRRDGSVKPDEAFELDWGVEAEGYPFFRPQISVSPDFPRGVQTLNMPLVRLGASFEVNRFRTRRIEFLLNRWGDGETFYWRVLAIDVDRTITVESDYQEVILSEQPLVGGGN